MKSPPTLKGKLVAVNALDDGQVYEVESLRGLSACLAYTVKGQRVDAGQLDMAVLKKPTAAQLARYEETR